MSFSNILFGHSAKQYFWSLTTSMTLDCPAPRPQWHMTAKRWHEWWNTAMSPCVCVKKWATSVGQWRSSVCCSESHYSYTFIISSFSPLRIDILIAAALCCVTRGTFVPINRQLRSARSHSWLLWLETKRLTSYAVPPRAEGKGLEGPAGIFSTRFGLRDTESSSCKDLAIYGNDWRVALERWRRATSVL